MARRTFFSFHYEQDVQRSAVVRKSSQFKDSVDAEWIDASLWEETKKNDAAIRTLIAKALERTTVTAVLIGSHTASRRWVQYEIQQSLARGNGLIGIYIHNIPGFNGQTSSRGANPLPASARTYDWVHDGGYQNLGRWVDLA
ncbi:TIR domain-containing protein [Rhodococcus sp. IEGM 1330]|uniref:TIR domain-containing protein n=1 Tax=Rhodococcus sp. IEGM 1330 TaxID=3082225 RepID=UPI00295424C4|nr:TIR domain-containing protein [Rhodococcus sp. IEGM 1330]MDV8021586.1 TIR domain-containing protein [Rhodococcus sp. IEGM 1330]